MLRFLSLPFYYCPVAAAFAVEIDVLMFNFSSPQSRGKNMSPHQLHDECLPRRIHPHRVSTLERDLVLLGAVWGKVAGVMVFQSVAVAVGAVWGSAMVVV